MNGEGAQPQEEVPSESPALNQLTSEIPYAPPGTSKHSTTPNTPSHIPLPPHGQLITGSLLTSPTVHPNTPIESRFVVSKQKIEARNNALSTSQSTKTSSSLANFFSKSRRGTISSATLSTTFDQPGISSSPVPFSTTPSSSTYISSVGNGNGNNNDGSYEYSHSPSSQNSNDSQGSFNVNSTRHSSMADLRRFFKKSVAITSTQQSPRVSNLSAGLRSSSVSSTTLPIPTVSNTSYSSHASHASVGITNASVNGGFDLSGSSPRDIRGTNGNRFEISPSTHAFSTSVNSLSSTPVSYGGNLTPQIPFSKRYQRFGESLGAGAGGQVKLVRSLIDQKVFAIKEFRAKFTTESRRDYVKKITGEYCVGSTLKHPNVIETIEISFENDRLVQVMEYCDYDLFAIVMSNKMSDIEVNCCFKQILNGVKYIHSIGLAHRDLKLDNCVINKEGIVKIIDFGSAVVYQYPLSNTLIEATGIVGSDPYLAPEVCVFNNYDPRPVDIWSSAMIYCCMTLKKFPWKVPKLSDPSFKAFASREPGVTFGELLKRLPELPKYGEDNNLIIDSKTSLEMVDEYPPTKNQDGEDCVDDHTSDLLGEERLLNALPIEVRPLIKGMVKLAPACRTTIDSCFEDEWVENILMCTPKVPGIDHEHTQVDQSVAHIASLERNKRKNNGKPNKY